MSRYTQALRIHQFHPSVSAGDAITQQMLFLQRAFQKADISGEVFAAENRDGLASILDSRDREIWNCDALWIHHSTGHASLPGMLKIEVPKALVYHNITPPHFFRHDPYLAYHCGLGKQQLELFREVVVAAYTHSDFSAQDLLSSGFSEVERLPLFDFKKLLPQATKAEKKKTEDKPRTLLFVGRLTPHKDQAFLIEMFFHFFRRENGAARLILVGKADPLYTQYLKSLRNRLGLKENVLIFSRLSAAELSTCYQQADALVCASHHEGFCVPLAEAMKAQIPIFAASCEGVEETLAGASIQRIERDPKVFSEIVGTILDDAEALRTVVESQKKRFAELQTEQSARCAQRVALRLLTQLRNIPFHDLQRARKEELCTELDS